MYAGSSNARREGPQSVLDSYIDRACSPMLSQPNLSLNLEIADYVNAKKANTPREAAFTALQYVNRRNTHIAMLGLHLLDILVKNCGYPFHLQIATKDFLNELVRRFPERPPVFPPPPMQKILELVHEWKVTICSTSKHKEDLVHIRDMHRLLSYKGYRFPDVDRRAASVLNDSDRLKSAEELEEEDRAAQAAKLQELIRRGTPKDLAAAQELMKIMSGAEPEKQVDYAAQMQKELDRVQSRVLLLNELLNNAKPGERFVEGDAFDQIAQKCKQVQPKLQKWIGEASEGQPDMMDRLLLINDLINNVLRRYASFKRGDFSATAEINPAFAGKETATAKNRAKEVSLIDFDDPIEAGTPPAGGAKDHADDAFGLGALSLGPTSSTSAPPPTATGPGGLPMGLFDSMPSSQPPRPQQAAVPPMGSFWSASSQNQSTTTGGANDAWARSMSPSPGPAGGGFGGGGGIALTGGGTPGRSGTPVATNGRPMAPTATAGGARSASATTGATQAQAQAGAGKAKDPFADLADLF